ncbi:MAG: TadE family protein, partial [Chloroflexota bacterium]
MQSVPKKIFQILDGTPAVYGQHSRGQSLVELALVTPLLIVLLMGLAEIGWFANNYLILLETTRVGARYGAVQVDTKAPAAWPLAASLIPLLQPDAVSATYAQSFRRCPIPGSDYERFFNTIVCPMIQSAMNPLPFRSDFTGDATTALTPDGGNGVDDIVVSTFALKSINPLDPDIPAAMRSTLQLVQGRDATQQQVIVVGRYPENANECTADTAADKDTRDPFDYINYLVPANTELPTRNYIVPTGLDPLNKDNWLYYELPGYDVNTSANPERQRGFDFTGQHVITSTRGLPV